jgi:Coenzyme PQQ synthesis protein D (PqqD)
LTTPIRPGHGPDVLAQTVGDAVVLLDRVSGEYYSLEGVGPRVWKLCDGSLRAAEIVAAVQAEYDAEPATIEADVTQLLRELAGAGLVVEVG